jgi:nitrogen fixation/metabolism regulation signal transduction histidine kinase
MMCIPFVGRFAEPNQLFFTYMVIAVILGSLTMELYFFLNRTIRELVRFLEHIRNRDFSLSMDEDEAKGMRKNLYRIFNDVLQTYRDIRIEKEVQFRFLEHIIELIEIGIIVFDQKGKVVLSNTAAAHLTGVPVLHSWDQMKKRNQDFVASVGSIKDSGRSLYESGGPDGSSQLAIQVSRTRMLEDSFALMTIQDIRGMVEHKETGAWIRLLRTLNHEIKNSVTPISSLTDTIMMILQHEDGKPKALHEIDEQNLSDIVTSVETLRQRSKSLHGFVDEYHKLTRIPVPDPEELACRTLLEETEALFTGDLEKTKIRIVVDAEDKKLKIRADHSLIEQVLINLVKNSMDALTDHPAPEIILASELVGNEVILSVADNGAGIEKDLLENIFIPFFSTKATGSGIGLSLVRQIMRLHGGDVRIASKKGKGTIVYLAFVHHTS